MLVILKIPVVYLCGVVWWAIRAEPHPLEGAGAPASLGPAPTLDPGCPWRAAPRRPSPRGGRSVGARRAAQARARAKLAR